ncbi:MAG: LytTR family DNA-binding domain-containing protein [Bacteroidota bacterium]
MKAVIIEDEVRNQKILQQLLEEGCPSIEVVGVAETVVDAKSLILEQKPELIFLDIQLKDGTGFDLLISLGSEVPYVIFTTAYDQYALKAFKFSAVDYLLKPIISEELVAAVQKVEKDSIQNQKISIKNLINNLRAETKESVITISGINKVEYVKVRDIVKITASGAYSQIKLQNGESHTVSKVIKEYQELLGEYGFFRTHQSHLINIKKVKTYYKGDHVVIMEDGEEVPVARNRKDDFLRAMHKIVLE